MRKILLVQDESYLDRALRDVFRLFGCERQLINKDEVLDLLAVILMPLSGDARLTSEVQTCELFCLAHDIPLFSPDSASVSGIWLLLTVSQADPENSTKRQEALRQRFLFVISQYHSRRDLLMDSSKRSAPLRLSGNKQHPTNRLVYSSTI